MAICSSSSLTDKSRSDRAPPLLSAARLRGRRSDFPLREPRSRLSVSRHTRALCGSKRAFTFFPFFAGELLPLPFPGLASGLCLGAPQTRSFITRIEIAIQVSIPRAAFGRLSGAMLKSLFDGGGRSRGRIPRAPPRSARIGSPHEAPLSTKSHCQKELLELRFENEGRWRSLREWHRPTSRAPSCVARLPPVCFPLDHPIPHGSRAIKEKRWSLFLTVSDLPGSVLDFPRVFDDIRAERPPCFSASISTSGTMPSPFGKTRA